MTNKGIATNANIAIEAEGNEVIKVKDFEKPININTTLTLWKKT